MISRLTLYRLNLIAAAGTCIRVFAITKWHSKNAGGCDQDETI
jgi:hypothetical protein